MQDVVKGADGTLVLRAIAPIVKDDRDIFRGRDLHPGPDGLAWLINAYLSPLTA